MVNKNKKIVIVEPPAYQFGRLNGDIASDEFSRVKMPARAAHLLEAILRQDGWTNVRTINPVFHGENRKFSSDNFREIFGADYLLIGPTTRTAPQSYELTRKSKFVNPGQVIVFGGFHTDALPEEALKNGGDVVVRKEGEAIPEILAAIEESRYGLHDTRGLVFRDANGEIVRTRLRKHPTPEELSNSPHPYYDEVTRNNIDVGVMETSRGCPNACDFCGVTSFYGGIYRRKSIEHVIEGLRQVQGVSKRNVVFITDDNIIGNLDHKDPGVVRESIDRFVELSYAIRDEGLDKTNYMAQITIAGARHPEVLEALRRMNVRIVCIGLESINQETLQGDLGKPYTVEDNNEGVRAYREAGLFVHGMLIIGPKDNKEYFKDILDWSQKNIDSLQLFPVGHFPGTPFDKKMKRERRVLSDDYYLRDGHHVLMYPDTMTPLEQQLLVNDTYLRYYSLGNSLRRLSITPNRKTTLGIMAYTMMGGVRRVTEGDQMKEHLRFLDAVSRVYPTYEAYANRDGDNVGSNLLKIGK